MKGDAKLIVGDQSYDLRLDFFTCPHHGVFVPSRFDADWTTDEGCPVPTYREEPCGESLTPVYLDALSPQPNTQPNQERYERMERELRKRADLHKQCWADAERDGAGYSAERHDAKAQAFQEAADLLASALPQEEAEGE